MGQKINPVCLRLHYTNRHFDSCWYSNYFYRNLLTQDILLQHYLTNFLKLVKLPAGRYSIHHLQKKTQIFTFLCDSKSTREWRSKVFGLLKKNNYQKKTRYFFKPRPAFKTQLKKSSKLKNFYTSLNQITVQKIQKKITSFQNFQLWSALTKVSKHTLKLATRHPLVTQGVSKNFKNSPVLHFSSLENPIFVFPVAFLKKTTLKNQSVSWTLNPFFKNEILIQNSENQVSPSWKVNTEKQNSWLNFLQNLVIYKTLKSSLKPTKMVFDKKTVVPFRAIDLKYKNYVESCLTKFSNSEIELIPFRVKNDWQNAQYLAEEIVYFLEKRIPFRRLKSKILKELSKISAIRGVRITCSGRGGGKSKKAQRAKMESLKYGETSLQVFSSKIDFSLKTAFTSFGSVGVKVWICYN